MLRICHWMRRQDPTEVRSCACTSALGILRGCAVQWLIHPLTGLKIRQQSSEAKIGSIFIEVWGKEGLKGFYRGGRFQLLQTGIKEGLFWPIIIWAPLHLQTAGWGDMSSQAMTGILIGTLDAAINIRLEGSKIACIATSYIQGVHHQTKWHGVGIYWARACVGWVTFLVIQKRLREQTKDRTGKPLSFIQSAKIGAQVAFAVSFMSAPLDVANIWKQTGKGKLSSLFFTGGMRQLYRGFPLSFSSMCIRAVTSVWLLEILSKRRESH